MAIIYGENPEPNGGVVILPRLVTGAYLYMSVLLSVVIGVVWLIFHNRKRANTICKYLLLVSVSYMFAYIVLGFYDELILYPSIST